MNSKQLIIGQVPENFDVRHQVPIARHCFYDREKSNPTWKEYQFTKDPLLDSEILRKYDFLSANEAEFFTQKLGNRLNELHQVTFSEIYWFSVLYPFVFHALQLLMERQEALNAFLAENSDKKYFVNLIEVEKWHFTDTADFVKNGSQSVKFNEWVYSILLKSISPSNIKLLLNVESNPNVVEFRKDIKSKLKFLIEKKILRFQKVYGMNWLETLFFETLIRLKPRISHERDNHDLKSSAISNYDWKIDVMAYLERIIPITLSAMPQNIQAPGKGKVMQVSNKLFYDDHLKKRVGLARQKGSFIIAAQHGGHHYGSSWSSQIINKLEYESDAFFSWGWKSDSEKLNIIDVSSPWMSKIRDKHQQRNNKIIMVGTRAMLYTYRIGGTRVEDWVNYREFKKEFLSRISNKIKKEFHYRPYFNELGSLRDLEYIKSYYHNVKILEGELHDECLNCKLLILDHPGTSLNFAMSANVPLILLWPEKTFKFNEEAEASFNIFRKLGILHFSAEEASKKVEAMTNVNEWWNQAEIQEFRKEWVDKYARASKNWFFEWAKVLWKL